MPKGGKRIQYQKPMAAVLTALAGPTLMGVYNFGWRVLATVALANAACFAGEYLFVRREGKPVTLAAFVTGTLFALVLPPNVPFWMVALGAFFAIVFGKMVFGGFGKNVFNPAMTGRCLLYVAFPLIMTGTWFAPIPASGGGFRFWNVADLKMDTRPDLKREVDIRLAPDLPVDGLTGATTLATAKKLNKAARDAKARAETKYPLPPEGEPPAGEDAEALQNNLAATKTYRGAREALRSVSAWKLFLGNISGSQGEGSALLILLGFLYLLYRKAVKWQLALGPALGMTGMVLILKAAGTVAVPLLTALKINFLGGGTMFALAFMTTEPVTAPNHRKAIWIYGALIGALAAIIRSMSVFNAGLMFSILIANMFAPLLDTLGAEYDAWRKNRAQAKSAEA